MSRYCSCFLREIFTSFSKERRRFREKGGWFFCVIRKFRGVCRDGCGHVCKPFSVFWIMGERERERKRECGGGILFLSRFRRWMGFVLRTTSVSPLDRDKDTLSLTREKCFRIFPYYLKISLHWRSLSRIGMFCGHFFSHAPQPMQADAVSPVSHGFFPMAL